MLCKYIKCIINLCRCVSIHIWFIPGHLLALTVGARLDVVSAET